MNLKNGGDRCVKIVGFGLGCVMDINRVTAARNFPNGVECARIRQVRSRLTIEYRGVVKIFAEFLGIHRRTRDEEL
jgi:hypothetical protein